MMDGQAQSKVLKRVGVVSDIHGQYAALEAALTFLRPSNIGAILCAGDIADESKPIESVERCLQLLIAAGIPTVRGNHDRWYFEYRKLESSPDDDIALSLAARAFLASFPPTLEFATARGSLLLCHGVGSDDMSGIFPSSDDNDIGSLLQRKQINAYNFVVRGHTHRRMARQVGGTIVLNPGPIQTTEGGGFLIVDFESGVVEFYDIASETNAISAARTSALASKE